MWQPGEFEKQNQCRGLTQIRGVGGNNPNNAFNIRDAFKNYFIFPQGSVPWQNDKIYTGRNPTE